MNARGQEIASHYISVWATNPRTKTWSEGPTVALPASFCVLEFQPTATRNFWTYATCCMSRPLDATQLELHLFSPIQYEPHVELLTVIAHYHATGNPLDLGHTVNFGRPWFPESACDYGFISLPYLDGPVLEHFYDTITDKTIRFLWLIPITNAERNYKKTHGIEALEREFEVNNFNYLDPSRQCIVKTD